MPTKDPVEKLRRRVEQFLRESVREYEVLHGTYEITYGSTRVHIRPVAWGESAALVRIQALVLDGVARAGNEAMFEEMCALNDRLVFGKLFWRPEDEASGRVILEHNLFGEGLQLEEFRTTLVALAVAADDLDEPLRTRYGGSRATGRSA